MQHGETVRQATAREIDFLVGEETCNRGPEFVARALDNMGQGIRYNLRTFPSSTKAFAIDVRYESIPEAIRVTLIKHCITPPNLQ